MHPLQNGIFPVSTEYFKVCSGPLGQWFLKLEFASLGGCVKIHCWAILQCLWFKRSWGLRTSCLTHFLVVLILMSWDLLQWVKAFQLTPNWHFGPNNSLFVFMGEAIWVLQDVRQLPGFSLPGARAHPLQSISNLSRHCQCPLEDTFILISSNHCSRLNSMWGMCDRAVSVYYTLVYVFIGHFSLGV